MRPETLSSSYSPSGWEGGTAVPLGTELGVWQGSLPGFPSAGCQAGPLELESVSKGSSETYTFSGKVS